MNNKLKILEKWDVTKRVMHVTERFFFFFLFFVILNAERAMPHLQMRRALSEGVGKVHKLRSNLRL